MSLPLAQRLELVQTLWDSIAAEQQGVAATAEEQRLVAERILIRPEAREDLRDASTWYADQAPGLGNRFLAAIREQFWIQMRPLHPQSCPHRQPNLSSPPNKTTTHKWRCHRPKQAAVADLEAPFIAHRQGNYRPAHHQVVAGGALDVDAGGTQTGRIGILFALAANGSAVQAMGDDMLKLIAAALINQVKKP